MSRQTIEMNDDLYNYVLSASLRETGLMHRLRKETAVLPNANMQIAPEQAQLLGLLIELTGARPMPRDRDLHRIQHTGVS